MLKKITRYEFDQIDCAFITACPRHREQFVPVLREYFGDTRIREFRDWDPEMDDASLFAYAYAKYHQARKDDPRVLERAQEDFELWFHRGKVPDYLCSYYRLAMSRYVEEVA
ncbi:MAG TPA: hypothetical protein VGE53_01155 [Candidatus Paceibacterota bacterium]